MSQRARSDTAHRGTAAVEEMQVAQKTKDPMTLNQRQLHGYLRRKRVGDIVTEQEILTQTGWARATITTYRSKHYIDPFLAYMKGGRYRIFRSEEGWRHCN